MLSIESAHLVGCFYTGQVGLDYASRLVELGARVAVPTTLNTGAVDLSPRNPPGVSAEYAERARHLMRLYEAMGARPLWSCAPYQAGHQPGLGSQVAWVSRMPLPTPTPFSARERNGTATSSTSLPR
jgi:predicted aconitase